MKIGDSSSLRTHHWPHTLGDLVMFRDPENARNRGGIGMIISLDKPDLRFVEVLWSSNQRSPERKVFLEVVNEAR